MDFQRFGIDPRLAAAAEGLPTSFFFYEKMLAHAVERQENVCAKIALDAGREEVLLLPALQWALSGEKRRLLVVASDQASAERCTAAIGRLGSDAGLGVCKVLRDRAVTGGEADADSAYRLEGDPAAPVLIGEVEGLLGSPALNLRDYGYLVVDEVDRLAELPSETVRKFCGSLLPSWERRSALACSRFSVKVKNLAWDLADNPSEISIEGEVAKAQSVRKETWKVPVEAKLKFLLGLIGRERPVRLCVFCNLKDTASDVTRRLAMNGIASDSVFASLSPERKFALIEKFRAGDCTCLVLSDEGADGLTPGVFPLIVNYDIPLEPELFVKRLEMLDRSDPNAKVVSLACDRYIYGLPAVEQYIDAKLEALPAADSMLEAVDRSEGKGAERRPRGDAYPRDARRSPPQRRESLSRDPRTSPDIRKSISEATGGALGISGPPPAANKDTGLENSRRGSGRPQSQRTPAQRQPAARPSSRPPARPSVDKADPSQRGHGMSKAGLPGNPYDMPMEERMKLYREKYGRGLGESQARNGPKKSQGGQPKVPRNGGHQSPSRGAQAQGAQGRNGKDRPAGPTKVPETPRPAQKPPLPEPEIKRKGMVSRILGGLRKSKG